MSLTAEDIVKVLKLASDMGLIKDAPKDAAPQVSDEEIIKHLSVFDEPTEEELLYWSTPYYDELQARKEAKKQALEEEAEVRDNG